MLLQIQPFSLDVSWQKVLLVEGIYDYCGFKLMFEKVLNKTCNFVIMPGTSASNLSTLLSLHIGWSAKICVLLDDDDEGRTQAERYRKDFSNIEKNYNHFEFC